MGQQLFKVHLDINDNIVVNSDTILSNSGKDDISFFFPLKTSDSTINPLELNNDQKIPSFQLEYIKQIQNHLALMTKSVQWEEMNAKIDEILMENIFTFISDQNKKVLEEINNHLAYKQQLQTFLIKKINEDNYTNVSIFAQPFIDVFTENTNDSDQQEQKAKYQAKQLSYFAIQSLTSILLILIKSAEKNDPTIIHQILTLTGQLCEQLPIKCLSSTSNFLFKSLNPLINYIHELSLTTDPIISKQTTKILLSFSIAKGSFKDILSLLTKLIFNTTDIYSVQGLFIQLNNSLTETINEWEKQKQQLISEEETDSDNKNDFKNENENENDSKNEDENDDEDDSKNNSKNDAKTMSKEMTEIISLDYLKSIGSFPNTQLIKLNEDLFTGQFISSIILSHLDIEDKLNSSNKQFKFNSISFEFHPNTFKHLFDIIEQLTTTISSQSNDTLIHILTICLRLFTTHLQFLSDVKSNLPDLTKYTTDNELKKWFELLLKLACDECSEQINICKEASKALINIINIQTSSFAEKLSLIHQYIIENKHPILIKQFLIELNKNTTLLNWIEILCDENKTFTTLEILYSFIDIYFNMKEEHKSQIQQILLSFQQILLSQLINQCEKKNLPNNEFQLSSLITQYCTYIFKKYTNKISIMNNLFNSILIGLYLMTKIDKIFIYEAIQPIFISILPLLAEYYLQNLNNQYNEFICCLLGKISHVLIIGLPQDSLEIKHLNKLKLPIFSGGCVINKNNHLLNSNLAIYSQFQLTNDTQDDQDFLMSIYNNIDQGAQLISKLKISIKTKQNLLQKSIEQQTNDACAAIFAVYIKHYRRINLAKSELLRIDKTKPYNKLLSIYKYANHIQTLFSTIKGQGDDYNEFYKQIKMKTLFLLLSIKENNLIPIIKEDLPLIIDNKLKKKEFHFQRQYSHWLKAKHILKLLQNLFQACIRFKKFMLEKKQEKFDYETLLNRTLDQFIYGNFSKLITNENIQLEIDELEKCLHRQQQRAIIRLITYRFIKIFIQNLLNKDQCQRILSIYLPYLRQSNIDWSYFDNIQASNNQLKDEISQNYYSIIQLILSFNLQSNNLIQNIFYLLNLSYKTIDIYYLYNYKLIEKLFIIKNFQSFNWFRLFVFKLCENIEIEKLINIPNHILQQQEIFIFNQLILNELKSLNNILLMNSNEQKINSLKNITLGWFIQTNKSIELYINQYLVLLLQSIYFYKHIVFICATIDYLEEFLYIYYHSQSNITRLLIIKLLCHLIPYISDDINGISRNFIENYLIDVLNSIGEHIISQEILIELIYMYRTIISIDSSWQIIAREFIFHSIKSYLNLKSIEINDKNQMNKLFASLFILGGYIESYRLGSIVKIVNNEIFNNESSLGLIIEINSNIDNIETSYLIQYLHTNQIESVSIDKLRLKINVPPPNLSNLNDSILDLLGYFIQIDTSTTESLILLQLKRRTISVLYYLLNDKKFVEIFMKKPYASVLAKLCISNSLEKPVDLRLFNKQHLEQYCLSLDTCERLNQIIENKDKDKLNHSISINEQNDSSYTLWNINESNRDQLIIDALSPSKSKYNGWKSYVSEAEMEFFKQNRIGNDEISIVPMPRYIADPQAIVECGIKHRFRGRIAPNSQNTRVSFPTFIVDNLQLSQGKWYYCVRLPVGEVVQIGWVTNGFSAGLDCRVGDDKYSWSYDGSRAVLFHDLGFYDQFNGILWKANDICGCGIEIDGENTKIKYWLNGKLLGTGFKHNSNIPLSNTKCNLLPNGSTTTYYPAISIQWDSDSPCCCELIFSPEDMEDCPLPDGYKPLLLPTLVHTENSIVDYPFSAYLVGDDVQDFFFTTRTKSTTSVLRDFVNEHHLETKFTLDDHHLILPDNSAGFLLSLDNDEASSFTISFDFHILSKNENLDFLLFKLDSTKITWKKTDEKIQCAIIFLLKEQQIKVYLNNKCRTFNNAFQYETIKKLNIYILPEIAAQIQNLAIWKYALSEEHIRRLFTYGLFYVANDYQQLKDYRKQVNTISFSKNQEEFTNEFLIPFNEPFTEDIWEKKKKQADNDESIYFKSHNHANYSTIELFSNKTYLVLDKSVEEWLNYTLILDIFIPHWPIINEKLTLIALNCKSEIYITHKGKLCLESDDIKEESNSTIILNEYFHLFISVQEESIQIYLNNNLEIDIKINDNRFQIKSNRINLFKERDFTKNTTNKHTLRVSFKSITYLNRSISIDQLQSSILIAPPFSIIGSSLIAMGYKKTWIQSVIEENKTTNIPIIHRILREQKQQFIKTDLENEQKRYRNIFSKLNPSINPEIFKDLINSSKFDTNEQITDIAQRISTDLISSQSSELSFNRIEFGENWFSQSVHDLGIHDNINEWIQDKTPNTENEDNIYQLLDLNQSTIKKTSKSIKYSHKNISSKQFLQSRIACEHGLTTIYARHTILNMLKVWSYDGSTLFPLEKFGDYTLVITLLKLLYYTEKDEKIDRIHLLIKSIFKTELKQLLEHINTIDNDVLKSKAPLFYHLQKDIICQSIQFLFKPSLFNQNSDKEIIINEQQPNFNFLLKILNLFIELLSDKLLIKQYQIDLIIFILFPISLINLIFNLFLLIPIHQSKISILYLFTTLIQISEHFKLTDQIQQFFFQLLIKLSSNKISINNYSKKKLQVPLMDLIYILLTKQKKQIQEFQSKLPDNIQNLFITIDVIIAWTDQTKQTLLPEAFIKQSHDILGNNLKLNQDDFKKSNNYFNTNADQELINFMNNNSFSNFIEHLPKESEPNPIFYKNYVSLPNIPADCIQIRARFFYLLNKFIENSLSLVDFSLPLKQSILTDQIRTIKLYLLSSTKFELLNESLEKTEISYSGDLFTVNFDTVKASTDTENSENTMFYQAYEQLHADAHIIFRRSNDQLWHAQYLEMHSTDLGGPYRDSITRICSDICSSRLSLFILCSNGRTNSGLNRDCWIPNVFPPNKLIPNKFQKQYRFIGQLMGMALRRKHYLNLKFPILLWKQLLKEPITIEDIEAIDIQSFTIINEMEKNIEQIKSVGADNDIDSLFSSIMSELRFDVVSSSGQTYELIPGGTDIPITAANFKHYCSCYRQYRLNEFNRQIDLIRQGLYSIIPCYYLNLFTANELEEAICGKSQFDVELLKRNTSYDGGYNKDTPLVKQFWTVLSEMFNDDQKKLFLIFVWGRSTLPSRDEDFQYKFTINSFDVYDGEVDKTLPRSHTCFFTLDLPSYSTTEIMYERLNYAISCCSSIDGDGITNDAFDIEDSDADDSLDE